MASAGFQATWRRVSTALVAELTRVLAQDPALAARVQQWVGGHGSIIATGGSAIATGNGIAIGTAQGPVTIHR